MTAEASPSTTPAPPGLELIYALTLQKLDQQSRGTDALNQKAASILTAASLITVAPTFRLASKEPPWQTGSLFTWASFALMIVAILIYARFLMTIRTALTGRDVNFPPRPKILVDHYLDSPPSEVQRTVVEDMARAYEDNRQQLWEKSDAINSALKLLLAEALTLALGIALS